MSLLVVTGYGFDLFGDCCSHEPQVQVEHGKGAPGKQVPAKDDSCQCICHQIIAPITMGPVRVASALLMEREFAVPPPEIPPDAVPLGIEYPPQLA